MWLLFLLFSPIFGQICISDFDCSSQDRCISSADGIKKCVPQIGSGSSYSTAPGGLVDHYKVTECFLDADCLPNQVCTVAQNGDRTCNNRAQEAPCFNDNDCGPRGACSKLPNGSKRCQIAAGGVVGGGSSSTVLSPLGGSCRRDSDCEQNLQCVSRNGVLSCLLVSGNNVALPNSCETSMDCPRGESCIYSVGSGRLICMNLGESGPVVVGQITTPGPQVGNIGLGKNYDQYPPPRESVAEFEKLQFNQDQDSTFLEPNSTIIPTYEAIRKPIEVPKHSIIDPAALPCKFDYQCRMGEACTGFLQMVDKNITVCQYDVTKVNRTCMYHSDCLSGQRCEEVRKGELFICQASLAATLGDTPCFFDYECSGGEKCVNLAEGSTKSFRCRPSKFADPRRNQQCTSNADCPFQQVCRHVAEVSICVDVGSSVSSAGTEEIQKKIVDFVHNLLFARV